MGITAGEIKNVIHYLKRQTQLPPKAVQQIKLLGGKLGEHTSGACAVGNQRGGFAIALFDVGLEALTGVIAVQTLTDLTLSQVHDHAGEQLDHFEVIEVGQMPAGLSKEKIAGEHSNTAVEAAVDSGHTPACVGLIDHIVMDQGGGMDHLGDLRQAAMARTQLTGRVKRPCQQQDNARAQALTSGTEEVLSSSLKDRMTGANQVAQVTQKVLEIGLDGLKQLGNRRHNPA